MTLFHFKYISFFIIFLLIGTTSAVSQQCPDLTPSGSSKTAYSKRGNRCEGFYTSKVSARSLDMVSLVKGKFHYYLNYLRYLDVIEVSSAVNVHKPFHVRAVGVPLKMYYRMDAHLEPGQTLKWPLQDVLYRKKIGSEKIGVFGWMGSEREKTYIPVSTIVRNPKTGKLQEGVVQDDRIRLVFRPSVDVKKVQWRISEWTGSGCKHARPWKDTYKRSYHSGQPVTIELTPPDLSEICFETAGWEASSGKWVKSNVLHIRLK
jgi:hypothetical protein